MRKYPGIPELLEAYMKESAADKRWVTVQEIRDRFGLTRYQSVTVSAFLRRLEQGPFVRFPYIVLKIERIPAMPSENIRGDRYLVTLRECGTVHKRGKREPGYSGTAGEIVPARTLIPPCMTECYDTRAASGRAGLQDYQIPVTT
ncbi:hypothetical protein [Methanoregula sp.]|jgi:hypothetical protein|uniref:hypothetical protein n=1 Tax=Methanoregula sp. TaxID=2052170 RepID=UPI0035688097